VDLTDLGSAHRGRPSMSSSVEAVARDVPLRRTLRHARAQESTCGIAAP